MQPDGSDEEVLDTGRAPNGRRRAMLVAIGGLAAAAVVGVVVARASSNDDHQAGPTGRPSPTSAVTVTPSLPAFPPVSSSDVVTATVGDTVYLVDAGSLRTVDLITGDSHIWHSVAAGDTDGDAQYRVLADNQRIWVVSSHRGRIVVSWFDPSTLAQTGVEENHGELGDASLLDGRLYLSTSAGVVSVSQTEEVPSPARPTIRGAQAMAADPSRHRLVLLYLDGARASVVAQRPTARTPEVRAAAPFGKGDLAVAGGRIWVAGFGASQALLERLDPRTLRPVAHSPLERVIGPGATIVTTDGRYLLVRDGTSGVGLWCVDARTGGVARHWPAVAGTPLLAESGVYTLVAGEPLERLDSRGCTG